MRCVLKVRKVRTNQLCITIIITSKKLIKLIKQKCDPWPVCLLKQSNKKHEALPLLYQTLTNEVKFDNKATLNEHLVEICARLTNSLRTLLL